MQQQQTSNSSIAKQYKDAYGQEITVGSLVVLSQGSDAYSSNRYAGMPDVVTRFGNDGVQLNASKYVKADYLTVVTQQFVQFKGQEAVELHIAKYKESFDSTIPEKKHSWIYRIIKVYIGSRDAHSDRANEDLFKYYVFKLTKSDYKYNSKLREDLIGVKQEALKYDTIQSYRKETKCSKPRFCSYRGTDLLLKDIKSLKLEEYINKEMPIAVVKALLEA